MAVLKDLIVHGASRFINTANYTTAKGGVLAADKGVFNKLIATNAEIENLNVDELNANNLTAQNATVVGLLDVQGELHTNSWTNANIANIGGSFYISPTLSSAASSVTISLNTSVTPNTYTITVSGGSFVTSSTGITWSTGSRVMVTGSIKRNNISYPLGTCTGNLNAISSTGFTVTDIKISNVNSAIPGDSTVNGSLATIVKEFGSGTTFTSEKITISMYEIGPSGSYKPVGILLTSYGLNKETYIDIYGGVNPKNINTTDNIPDGYTDPNVRIGYLGGIPQYKDSAGNFHKPTGWGIYTDNGYFKGVVVADSGLIGGWTINSNALYYKNSVPGASTDTLVLSPHSAVNANAIANSPTGFNWFLSAGRSFGVTTSGVLYATGAHISGTIDVGPSSNVYNIFAQQADSVKRTQRIYYYAPSEGEGEESTESETLSAPETPNDWISASSGVETWINQRIEEVPASSGSGTEPLSVENYPNVWVSEQTEMVNGDIDCTPPKLDSISSIALDAQDLVNSLSDTINGENGLSEAIRLLTGSIIINPGDFTQTPPIEPSITIQTNSEEEGAETGKAALTLTSTQLILEKNNDAVITLDSTQDDGAIEANEIILNSGLRIGNLEIIPYNGGIGIRAWEVEE